MPHSSPNGPRTRGNTHVCYASTPLKSISSSSTNVGKPLHCSCRAAVTFGSHWLQRSPAQTDRHNTGLQATHTQPASLPVCLSLCESSAPSCCGLYFVVKSALGSFVCLHRRVFWKRAHIRVCELDAQHIEKACFNNTFRSKKTPIVVLRKPSRLGSFQLFITFQG